MVHIEPAPSCLLGLHWELRFDVLSAEQVLHALVKMKFIDQTRMLAIRTFLSATGERIIVIPKTGRVQLRLDLSTPKAERPARATAIAQWIVASA